VYLQPYLLSILWQFKKLHAFRLYYHFFALNQLLFFVDDKILKKTVQGSLRDVELLLIIHEQTKSNICSKARLRSFSLGTRPLQTSNQIAESVRKTHISNVANARQEIMFFFVFGCIFFIIFYKWRFNWCF
jgi:hypothetical protein